MHLVFTQYSTKTIKEEQVMDYQKGKGSFTEKIRIRPSNDHVQLLLNFFSGINHKTFVWNE